MKFSIQAKEVGKDNSRGKIVRNDNVVNCYRLSQEKAGDQFIRSIKFPTNSAAKQFMQKCVGV